MFRYFTCAWCNLVTFYVSADMKDYCLLGSMDVCAALQEELEKSEESDESGNSDNGSKQRSEMQDTVNHISKDHKADLPKQQPKV